MGIVGRIVSIDNHSVEISPDYSRQVFSSEGQCIIKSRIVYIIIIYITIYIVALIPSFLMGFFWMNKTWNGVTDFVSLFPIRILTVVFSLGMASYHNYHVFANFSVATLDTMMNMVNEYRRYAYNDWADVFNPKHDRYSPLLTALMKRKDCREFFVNYSLELMNTIYTYDSVNELLVEMDMARYSELHGYYYDYLKSLRKAGDTSIWTNPSYYDHYMEQIRTFTTERPAYAEKYLNEILNME